MTHIERLPLEALAHSLGVIGARWAFGPREKRPAGPPQLDHFVNDVTPGETNVDRGPGDGCS